MKFLSLPLLVCLPAFLQAQYLLETTNPRNSTKTLLVDTSNKIETHALIFSDLAGTMDDQPNGLIQTEGLFSWALNSTGLSLKKKPRNSKKQIAVIPLRNIVVPELVFSKIDQNNRYLPIRYFDAVGSMGMDSTRTVNALDLIQYSNLNVNLKLNLLTYIAAREVNERNNKRAEDKAEKKKKYIKGRVFWDALFSHYSTGVVDSLRGNFQRNINSYSIGTNLRYKFSDDRSGLSLQLTYFALWMNVRTPGYAQIDNQRYLDFTERSLRVSEENPNKNSILVSGGSILVSSKGKTKNSTFLKISYFTNGPLLNKDQNFFQIQLGQVFDITKLFNSGLND